jgi:DNA-binding MarR family transcriptional regulator
MSDPTAAEVSTRINLTPVQVGRCVAKLKTAGLIKASVDVNDGRASRLSLQPKGTEVEALANKISTAVQRWAIRDLSAAEWKIFNSLLDRLLTSSQYTESDAVDLMDSIRKSGMR